jgi:hypothetical protein
MLACLGAWERGFCFEVLRECSALTHWRCLEGPQRERWREERTDEDEVSVAEVFEPIHCIAR